MPFETLRRFYRPSTARSTPTLQTPSGSAPSPKGERTKPLNREEPKPSDSPRTLSVGGKVNPRENPQSPTPREPSGRKDLLSGVLPLSLLPLLFLILPPPFHKSPLYSPPPPPARGRRREAHRSRELIDFEGI